MHCSYSYYIESKYKKTDKQNKQLYTYISDQFKKLRLLYGDEV